MTLVAFDLDMFICERIFCFGVVRGDLFPALGGVAFLAFWLIFMRIFMTGTTLFKLINPISVFYMTLLTLYFNVFPCKEIFRIPVMIELFKLLPSLDVVAALTVPVQFPFMFIFMAGDALL